MRISLAILIACAVFGALLASLIALDGTLRVVLDEALFTGDEGVAPDLIAVLLAFLLPPLLMIAGGVALAPKAGLRSFLLDRVRGDATPTVGRWANTAVIGFAACLLTLLASATVQVLSPASFSTEEYWRDMTMTDVLKEAIMFLSAALLGWVGLLSPLAWGFLKILGAARRTFALAAAILLTESISLGLAGFLTIYLDYSLDLAVVADGLIWSMATAVCAWLYVTRTLEHGVLTLMWLPILRMAFRPLWGHLGI